MRGSGMNRGLVGSFLSVFLAAPVAAQQPDTRLVDAVRGADRHLVQALLGEPVDVNARQPDGATALHWAAYLNDLETTALLIEAGAVAGVANQLGATPLYLACENGNAALVRALLAAGASPRAALPSGETALMRRRARAPGPPARSQRFWKLAPTCRRGRRPRSRPLSCGLRRSGTRGSSKPCWTRERTSTHARGSVPW